MNAALSRSREQALHSDISSQNKETVQSRPPCILPVKAPNLLTRLSLPAFNNKAKSSYTYFMNKYLSIVILLSCNLPAWAESPVGHWQTVNEESGATEAIVEIWKENNELQGKIIELLNPEAPNPVCTECKDEKKDQPIIGLTIIWGLSENGDGWDNGYILDPNNGVTYNSNLKVNDRGELEVRGFVGIAMLGRTQIWYRAE